MSRRAGYLLALTALVLVSTPVVKADVPGPMDVLNGLYYAGLFPRVQRDIYQDGWVVDFGRTFVDTTYDFGNVEMTLNGALDGQFTIGHRGIDEISYSLSTPGGLAFQLVEWDGINEISVDDGLLNIEQNFKVNRYGFYTLEMNIVGRGTTVTNGILDDSAPIDFNVGPIDIQGHLLLDLVNVILYNAFGTYIPGGAFDAIVLGDFIQSDLAADLLAGATIEAQPEPTAAAAPEPSTLLVLALGGIPLLWRRIGR